MLSTYCRKYVHTILHNFYKVLDAVFINYSFKIKYLNLRGNCMFTLQGDTLLKNGAGRTKHGRARGMRVLGLNQILTKPESKERV